MIALLFAPYKGNVPYPPLAICALKSWLSINSIDSCAIDINKSLAVSNPPLSEKVFHYFAQPRNLVNNQKLTMYYNIDTIYNLKLLLAMLFPNKYPDYEFDVSTKSFCNELIMQLESDSDSLLASGFRYFGFSTYVSNICYSILLAQMLKKKDSRVVTFFGGHSTAYAPIRDFLIKTRIADYVLVGEGENAIVKLCCDLQTNSANYKTIYSENIAPKNLNQDEIVVPIIKNLNELPFPDFSDLNLEHYAPIDEEECRFLSISTSRGCVNNCAYCSETQYWSNFRQKSVSRVINEIQHAINVYQTNIFFFCDSLINGNIKWLSEFCHQLIEKEIDMQWSSYATINHLDKNILKLMSDSGCYSLTLGIEHISQKVLAGVNKTSSIGNTKAILIDCIDLDIFPIANIIYALPNEQNKDFLSLLYFITDPEFNKKVQFTFRPYEIRVGSAVAAKLMKTEKFISNNIQFSQLDADIQDAVRQLDMYWLPGKKYIKNTIQKANVIGYFV